MSNHDSLIRRCAEALSWADSLLITAGAGMGVDSGLPDFRGKDGFWSAYPALKRSGIGFYEIAVPDTFRDDPCLAWGFYGHRLNLYREVKPHSGFSILRKFARHMERGFHVYTSNVDGHFQKAGFAQEQVFERHGSIHYLQCLDTCSTAIWTADGFDPVIDMENCRLLNAPPRCPACGGIARPNILMFGDCDWLETRAEEQQARLDSWLKGVNRLVVIEIGSGKTLPGVRYYGESRNGFLIRINPKDAELPARCEGVGLAVPGLEALRRIREAWQRLA